MDLDELPSSRYELLTGSDKVNGAVREFLDRNVFTKVGGMITEVRNRTMLAALGYGNNPFDHDEAYIAKQTRYGDIKGIVTMSALGEGARGPTVVGCAVQKAHQHMNIALQLMEKAVDRLQLRIDREEEIYNPYNGEKRLVQGPIHIDCISRGGSRLVEKLLEHRPDFRSLVKVWDMHKHAEIVTAYGMMEIEKLREKEREIQL